MRFGRKWDENPKQRRDAFHHSTELRCACLHGRVQPRPGREEPRDHPVRLAIDESEAELFLTISSGRDCVKVDDRVRKSSGSAPRQPKCPGQTSQPCPARYWVAGTRQCRLDKAGRLTMPEEFCKELKLSGEVALLGRLRTFEIWNAAERAIDKPASEAAGAQYHGGPRAMIAPSTSPNQASPPLPGATSLKMPPLRISRIRPARRDRRTARARARAGLSWMGRSAAADIPRHCLPRARA